MDVPAGADDRGDEVGHPVGLDAPDDDPVAVRGDFAERSDRVEAVEPGRADPHAVRGDELQERADSGDPAEIDDRDAVADELRLAQEMRVQADGRALRTARADDLTAGEAADG